MIAAMNNTKKCRKNISFLLVNQEFFVPLQSRFSGTSPERLFN